MMVAVMRLTAVLLCGFLAAASSLAGQDAPAAAPGLREVRTVYLLPMANGFDQFLASRLTRGGAVLIVADPAKADAIFTDRLGSNLERKLDELYPPPAKPEPAESEKKKDETAEASAQFANAAPPVPVSSFSRGKGTLFLVSAESRSVLWSTFEKSRGVEPEALNKMADRVASRFEREIKPKPAR
jgi:hypothetical protein